MGLRDYLQILRRRRRLVLAATLACVLGALAVSLRMAPVYEGIAEVEAIPPQLTSNQGGLVANVSPTWARTQVQLIRSHSVLSLAKETTGASSVDQMRKSLEVDLVTGTDIVEISVERNSPREAAQWANGIAEAYIAYRREQAVQQTERANSRLTSRIRSIEEELEELRDDPDEEGRASALRMQQTALESQLLQVPHGEAANLGAANIITPAVENEDPVRPSIPLILAIAGVLGLLIGSAAALIRENLDDRLSTSEEIEANLEVAALGYIPLVKGWAESEGHRIADDDAVSVGAAEAYRTLAVNILAASHEKPGTILVTSATPDAGKSTTSANLAAVMAQAGHKVILVGGDLRKPSIHKFFGMTNKNGVVDVVRSDIFPSDLLQQNTIPNLRLIPAGDTEVNPTEILGSPRFAEFLETLKSVSDVVIIDSTPILGLGDASVLASKVDSVLLVVNMADAGARQLTLASRQIAKAGGRLMGCVVIGVNPLDSYAGYYAYGGGDGGRTSFGARFRKGERGIRSPGDAVQPTAGSDAPDYEAGT